MKNIVVEPSADECFVLAKVGEVRQLYMTIFI